MSVAGEPRLIVKTVWTKNRHTDKVAAEQGYVWLQGVGYCKAKPLEDFLPGERMGWNYGSTSEVVELLRNKQDKVVGVRERYAGFGGEIKVSDRVRRGSTLTAWAR